MATERSAKRRRLSPPGDSVPGFATWNLEQDYEQRQRKGKKKEGERLLVKKADGWKEDERLKEVARLEAEAAKDDSDQASEADEQDSGVADLEAPATTAQPDVPVKEQIRQAKEDLARIAGHISESPEENIAQLGQLAEIARSHNVTVKKLALGTQLAVYKDIIPGYRIRPLSKEDQTAKVGKEVRRLRTFEQTLLAGYKDYISHLTKLAQDKTMRPVAITCATNLLISVPHFNNRNEIMALLVKQISFRNLSPETTKCCEALSQLFREDDQGHASLEAVTQMTKMMKTKNYHVHENVLNTFLHLRLLSEFAHKAGTNSIDRAPVGDEEDVKKPPKKKDREYRSKRERKVMKERKAVAKELQEADAVVSYEDRDKSQAETLKLVFVAYFRILKARKSHLMGAVLEGLARYAHLINQDFFGDVLEVLKDLILEAEAALEPTEDDMDVDATEEEEEDELDAATERNITRERLLCIITAFALLQGQHDVVKSVNTLQLDLNFFITHLYRTLLPLALNADIELSSKSAHLADPNGLATPAQQTQGKETKVNVATTTVLLLKSLQSVLLPPQNTKMVPPMRVAAFVKQLHTLALQLPAKSAAAVLALIHAVGKTHGNKVAALWNTEERKQDGVFDARGLEVEGSNPFAATVWEGEILRHHWDPKVRDGVKGVDGVIRGVLGGGEGREGPSIPVRR
ncbi:hypothetical protein LTR62_002898 [Meristemomyces frigidus]|uniref:Nucleolar complex-associated protein 3 n=1 Tax=Meristemomyces frigidus TaxID=1508187 RepID=A0AAN7YJT8_9PEZI|nr:hypothetical protein LTR62_002898 [Meristemomyces frigidus]